MAETGTNTDYSLWRQQQRLAPYLFVAPFVLLFCIFGVYPILKSLYLAFHTTNGPRSVVFTGIQNFVFLLKDPDFYTALKNTATFTFYSVFLQLPLSLGLAMLLNCEWLRGRFVYRFVFFSPYLLGQVFVAVLSGIILAPRFGLVPQLIFKLSGTGLETKLLGDPDWVMTSIVCISLWMYVGYNSVYFLAALQSVDKELYEAAAVDGASYWQQFLNVTLPSIKPVILVVVIMSTIGSFQLFELPYTLLNSSSGPNKSGLTLVMYLYQRGFEIGNLGYASTIGWTLTLIVMSVSLAQKKMSRGFRGQE